MREREVETMRLVGKTAIVTGAGQGFGEGIVKLFAREGAAVVVADINEGAATRVAKEIEAEGGRAAVVACDVSTDSGTGAMIRTALDRFGKLDVVVNNAGVTHRNMPCTEVTEADFDRVMAVNVKALFWAAKHVVPLMQRAGGGVILTTASTAGIRPRPGLAWYNTSKGAAITATKALAIELAPFRIRVNCLCPVAGETPLLPAFMGGDTPELREKFRSTVPLGRLSTPLDIARAALFLASDEAEFLTGVALEVDGGRCI